MPSLNIRGVPCEISGEHENEAGIVRGWTEYGPQVTARFMVDWDRGQDLAAALLGSVVIKDDGSMGRIPPYNLPWAQKLYCVGLGDERPMTPRHDPTGWVYYEKTEIVATFAALTWQIAGDDQSGQNDPSGLPYTTTKFRVSSETIQPPKSAYYSDPFGTDAKLVDDALVGFILPRVEIQMLRRWQPRVPLDVSMRLIGSVNDETIRLGDRTFPRGCLLFAGLENEPRNDPNGYPVQDLNYTFLGRYDKEWNKFLGPDGDWHLLNTKNDGTGDWPFPYEDQNQIFLDYIPAS